MKQERRRIYFKTRTVAKDGRRLEAPTSKLNSRTPAMYDSCKHSRAGRHWQLSNRSEEDCVNVDKDLAIGIVNYSLISLQQFEENGGTVTGTAAAGVGAALSGWKLTTKDCNSP